jgi:hypothetical protein
VCCPRQIGKVSRLTWTSLAAIEFPIPSEDTPRRSPRDLPVFFGPLRLRVSGVPVGNRSPNGDQILQSNLFFG